MKTKSFLTGIFALVLSLLLPSCGALQDPETWAVEIEDSYRAQVTLTFAYAVYEEDVIDAFSEKLDKEAEKAFDESDLLEADCPGYKLALEKMAGNDELAADLLDGYNKLDVKFSEWIKQPKQGDFSIWTSTEENSGVKVTFKNNKLLEWDLELDEKSLTTFAEQVIASIVGETASVDEEVIEDAIVARIESQYANRMPDNKIMSKAFYSVFHKAQQADASELGWPDWDYWECTQGAYAKLSSVDVDVISETKAIAHVVLFYPENGEYTEVEMPMVYENDNWYVDDIITEESYGRSSLKDEAKQKI